VIGGKSDSSVGTVSLKSNVGLVGKIQDRRFRCC
jgi:hypothetical protein